MLPQDFIARLNKDLSNEWKHMCFYLHSASTVTGLHAHEYKEFLLEQAASEMKHVQQFSDMILGIGGVPTTEVAVYPSLENMRLILDYAAEMEFDVVRNYTQRIAQLDDIAEDASGSIAADKKWLEIFLEEQIKDSREDLDHLKQLIVNA